METNAEFKKIDKYKFNDLLKELRNLQTISKDQFGEGDIFSNSKVYEMIIANVFSHNLVPGHSNTRDACDVDGNEYEYKHYKESSSNHSWTFNDYSVTTIKKLEKVKSVIFAHINDLIVPPICDWYLNVPGDICSKYLETRTTDLLVRKPKGHVNNRRMINFSPRQLEEDLKVKKVYPSNNGPYSNFITKLFDTNRQLEEITGVTNILTSNKFWEVLVGVELNHHINAEQGGREGAHDAMDEYGNKYEYKVAKNHSWNFQDISENVLNKYLIDNRIILATVDKDKIKVKEIYSTNPYATVKLLRKKLQDKQLRFKQDKKELRRLQVSLSMGDIQDLQATRII